MSDFEDKLNSILSSPKDMEKIMALARSLSGGEGEPDASSPAEEGPSGPDPRMMAMLTKVMSGYSAAGDDRKTALLRAMQPYLRQERQESLRRAVEIARMAKMAKIALSELTGGDDRA